MKMLVFVALLKLVQTLILVAVTISNHQLSTKVTLLAHYSTSQFVTISKSQNAKKQLFASGTKLILLMLKKWNAMIKSITSKAIATHSSICLSLLITSTTSKGYLQLSNLLNIRKGADLLYT